MRTFALRALLSAALLVTARPAPAEVSWGGNVGLSLNRSDQWSRLAHDVRSSRSFTGTLRLDASLFAPGTLDLGGSASFVGYRADGGSASDGFNYQLRLQALAQTPVNLSAMASRSTTEFTADTSGTRVGTTRVDAVSGTLVVASSDYPILRATIRDASTRSRAAGGSPVRSEVTSLDAEASQSLESLNYSLAYDTAWSSGDYAETNYRVHNATFRTQAELAPGVTAQATAAYNLRSPTLVSPFNPRLDNQALATWVQWVASPDTSGGGGYQYNNYLFETPGSSIRQALSHAANGYLWHRLSRELSFDLGASGSTSQSRLGTIEQRATGEQGSASLRWTRPVDRANLGASLGGSLGLFQPDGSPNAMSWGVAASADASRPLGTWLGSASLGASRDENTGASRGIRTRIYASLDASGSPRGWSFRGLLTTGYTRSESPLYGTFRSLNLRLDTQAFRSGYQLGLAAGVTDDLSEALAPGAPPVSAQVPVAFNTQSQYATATATVPTITNLSLTLIGRTVSVTAPGRGTQWENGLSLSVRYVIGAFQLSLYDQLTVAGNSGASSGTQNLIFLSVTRSFGR